MRRGWHIREEGGVWTLSRRLPARFDLSAETVLPQVSPKRLMHQIRQDIWRALRRLRGFQPAVRLVPSGADWRVTAGGAVDGAFTQAHHARLCAVLESPAHRNRWIRWAAHTPASGGVV